MGSFVFSIYLGIFVENYTIVEDKTIIITQKGTYTASEYQQNIFEEVAHGAKNLVITASAGSAKTSTIENCLRFIPDGKKVLYVAFNKSTVDKLVKEIGKSREGLEIYTFHGLGVRILKENGIFTKDVEEVDDFKYSRYLKENLLSLTDCGEVESLGELLHDYVDNINRLINYSRYYLKMTEREIGEAAEIYGIVPVRDEYSVVRKCLIWGKNNTGVIDHTDMIWLPNVLNMTTKYRQYDYIFIDEAQDMTLARQGLVDKVFKRGARFFAVGDRKQQINVWCGATEESLDNYLRRPNTIELTLPVSYRIPLKVEEIAKKYSPNITARPGAPEGIIRTDVSANDAQPGDLVLCRMSSNLIEQYLQYARDNKNAYLKGYDAYRDEYKRLVEETGAKRIDIHCATKEGMFTKLYQRFFDEAKNLMNKLNIDEDEAFSHPKSAEMLDKIQALKALSAGLDTTDELIAKINMIFTGEKENAIQMSTIHKAKGLEAENVYILAPSLLFNPQFAKTKWEIESEKNLAYVAITRARYSLNFIKEEEHGFYANLKKGKLRESLEDVKKRMGYKPLTQVNKIDQTTIGNNPSETAEKGKKKKKGGLAFVNLMNS